MSGRPLPRTFDEKLIEELDNKANGLVKLVMSGNCKDMREYGFYTGQYVGLQACKQFVKELVSEAQAD